MLIHSDLNQLPQFKNAVITIGTFDGVHKGHQKLLSRINHLAKQEGGESILITFHPHPRMVINPDVAISLLSPLGEKAALLRKTGIDHLVVVPFTRDFSQQSPLTYIEDFLVGLFKPKRIVIGYNHKFGKNRGGDIHMLIEYSAKYNFEVEEISKLEVQDLDVSSTKIREALSLGQVEKASTLLGHNYSIKGIVVKGRQLGHKIGFPTANLHVQETSKLIPSNGVYVVKVNLKNAQAKGMMNIGLRPTVDGHSKTIEVHLFDFDSNIYGEELSVEFIAFLRKEQKFENIDALILQLKKDEKEARAILN